MRSESGVCEMHRAHLPGERCGPASADRASRLPETSARSATAGRSKHCQTCNRKKGDKGPAWFEADRQVYERWHRWKKLPAQERGLLFDL